MIGKEDGLLDAELSITRTESFVTKIKIEVVTATKERVRIWVSPEQFALALTGVAQRECWISCENRNSS